MEHEGALPIARGGKGKASNNIEHFKMQLPMSSRPPLSSQQSSSLPSTPYQHARKLSDEARIPPPVPGDEIQSPSRSAHSETDSSLRAPGRGTLLSGCKYETGMAFSRRRIPYSEGGDKLERASSMPKKYLDPNEEGKLSGDMRELYDRLLPSMESEERRSRFVHKVETLLNKQWPGNNIKVFVFGSSGNKLYTTDSDVDICITTPMKALERVCLLAKALAENGMERVVCVPNAKVPIVKIWDPELELACDLNVNNTLALENTRMIKTYVEIDNRVRPLAMIVKHWTKMRILNDAALGGTLSSYTWICMILSFLQTRNPPILPSLHKRPHQRCLNAEGKLSSFADDLDALRGFGRGNKETMGELLFHFFRRYGHEIDYERNVISVREGGLISKQEKKWHLMQNNRLCVEEPFNIERNLGNTTDDISFRGVHLEIRRAFDLLAEGKFEECFEQYEFPPMTTKVWEKPAPQPRPILSRSVSQSGRTGRGAHSSRGNRPQGQHRAGVQNRRASSAAAMGNGTVKLGLNNVLHSAPGLQIHDQLYSQYQLLQQQEAQLRLQMHQRAQAQQFQSTPSLHPSAATTAQLQSLNLASGPYNQHHPNPEGRRRQHTIDQPPLTAPLGQMTFLYPPQSMPKQPKIAGFSPQPQHGVHTNPSSPSMTHAQPMLGHDPRRGLQRGTVENEHFMALQSRSRSQPASVMRAQQGQPSRNTPYGAGPVNPYQGAAMTQAGLEHYQHTLQQSHPRTELPQLTVPRRGSPRLYSPSIEMAMDDLMPKEYVGYYLHDMPHPHYTPHTPLATIPPFHDLAQRNKGLSPNITQLRHYSRSPSPSNGSLHRERSTSFYSTHSTPSVHRPSRMGPPQRSSGPIIADGSGEDSEYYSPPERVGFPIDASEAASLSDEPIYTPITSTNASSLDPYDAIALDHQPEPGRGGFMPSMLQFGDFPARSTMRQANRHYEDGSTLPDTASTPKPAPAIPVAASPEPSKVNGVNGLGIKFSDPTTKQRRPPAGITPGSIAPIPAFKPQIPKAAPHPIPQELQSQEVALGGQAQPAVLSPVREVRTPSPTVVRKEEPWASAASVLHNSVNHNVKPVVPPTSIIHPTPKHGRSVSSSGPSPLGNMANGNHGVSKAPPTTRPAEVHSLKMNGQAAQLVNGFASGAAPSNAQASGWQQTTKKGKKGKGKSAGSGQNGETVSGAERKGG